MKIRKQANSQTSIHFGNEVIDYISDAQENQLRCQGGATPAERARQKEVIRKMKADLTTTNFCLGDEKIDYTSANGDAMAAAETFKGTQRVAMNKGMKHLYTAFMCCVFSCFACVLCVLCLMCVKYIACFVLCVVCYLCFELCVVFSTLCVVCPCCFVRFAPSCVSSSIRNCCFRHKSLKPFP